MNEQRIKSIFPNASKSLIQLNSGPSGPEPQPAVHNGADGKASREEKDPGRYLVRITSLRARPCDPDNLVGKYFLDAFRYAGLLHDDRPEDIDYEITQRKVSKTQEKTLIEIWPS